MSSAAETRTSIGNRLGKLRCFVASRTRCTASGRHSSGMPYSISTNRTRRGLANTLNESSMRSRSDTDDDTSFAMRGEGSANAVPHGTPCQTRGSPRHICHENMRLSLVVGCLQWCAGFVSPGTDGLLASRKTLRGLRSLRMTGCHRGDRRDTRSSRKRAVGTTARTATQPHRRRRAHQRQQLRSKFGVAFVEFDNFALPIHQRHRNDVGSEIAKARSCAVGCGRYRSRNALDVNITEVG